MKDLANYGEWENIKRAIDSAIPDFNYSLLRPVIWKDEINDIFFITKCAEIYFYDKTTLRIHFFKQRPRYLGSSFPEIQHIIDTDDGIHVYEGNISELVAVLSYPSLMKQRMQKNCGKIGRLEERLGHKIIPTSFPKQKNERGLKKFPSQLKDYLYTKSPSG